MRVPRLHSQKDFGPLKGAASRAYVDGDGLEYAVPRSFGDAAAEVLVQSVFYRAAVPALLKPVPEDGVPEFLWRKVPDDEGLDGISAEGRYRHERDFRDVFSRIAGGLAYAGIKTVLFDSTEDASTFHDELIHLLLNQMAAPEAALLQSAGLHWAYGIDAAFVPAARIAGFSDALFAENIAGAGVAVSQDAPEKNILKRLKLLGERQALDGGDRISVTLPVESVDSPAFVNMKREQDAAHAARELGGRVMEQALAHVVDACDRESVFGFDPDKNLRLKQAMRDAARAGVSDAAMRMAVHYAQQGFEDLDIFRQAEDAPLSVPLSATLSVPDEFIESALTGHGFLMTEGGEAKRHYPAEKLWNNIGAAIWAAGEPALFFRDSASACSLVPGVSQSGQGGAVFVAGTSIPAATLNLPKFAHATRVIDTEKLTHAAMIMTTALEASFALLKDADATPEYRPVAIGITGIAPLLMGNGLAYDGEAGRATATLVTALVAGAVHETSAALAKTAGAFPAYKRLEKECLQQVKDKISALSGTLHMKTGLSRRPASLKAALCPDTHLAEEVKSSFARAYALARETGFRHAHLTAIGSSDALRALLGAQSRDIAPVPALVRFEGYFENGQDAAIYGKKLNPAVPKALSKLGFNAQQIDDITFYAVGHGTLFDAPAINHGVLKTKGFHRGALDALEAALRTAQHIRYVFNKWTLGEDFCTRMLGFTEDQLSSGTFDMLEALGFSEDDIDAANLYCCGAMTLEGAPHLNPKHLPVFDCLAAPATGVRRVAAEAQLRMQAALEPFLSGSASHTVELPHYAAIDEVQKLALLGWELGVKRLHLYRDGCSLLSPAALQPPVLEELPVAEPVPQKRIRVVS